MLAPDVRLEGFTAEDWMRLVSLFKSPPPRAGAIESAGGIFVIHEDGMVRKALHTKRGRLERRGAIAKWPATTEAERTKLFVAIAEQEHASWVVSAEVGALDEVMERFGARSHREDDIVAQSLRLVEIVRELMQEGRIEGWPRRLKNIPAPSPTMVRRAVDALCKTGHAIALGAFKDGELFTAIVIRRAERGFDLIRRTRRASSGDGTSLRRLATRRSSPRVRDRRSLRAAFARMLRRRTHASSTAKRFASGCVESRGRGA